jgi:hypothetical protein
MKIRYCLALLVLVAALETGAGAARAGDVREQQSQAVWRQENECSHDAFEKFPDYTPESNAARERVMRDCENKHHIPVRAPVSESPVKTLPDAAAD